MRVESLWWPRLRWRLRGAWQWPAFIGLTALDTLVISLLPFYGEGPDALGAFLLAVFFNLVVVAAAAPVAGVLVRRRRPDLPRLVARDYAGTAMLAVATVALVAAGLAHRSALGGERAAQRAALAGVHAYVVSQAPAYRPGLTAVNTVRVEPNLYRACVPGRTRWLCLYVKTDQSPAGVTVDGDTTPNGGYRAQSGVR
ncbi:MAG TPA: hypothetical protein VH418_03510 [Solirubrobacteraceae bacterium]